VEVSSSSGGWPEGITGGFPQRKRAIPAALGGWLAPDCWSSQRGLTCRISMRGQASIRLALAHPGPAAVADPTSAQGGPWPGPWGCSILQVPAAVHRHGPNASI